MIMGITNPNSWVLFKRVNVFVNLRRMSFHKAPLFESEIVIRNTPNYTDHSLSVGRSVGSGRRQTNGIYAPIEQAARDDRTTDLASMQ